MRSLVVDVDNVLKAIRAVVFAGAWTQAVPFDSAAGVARTVRTANQVAVDIGLRSGGGDAHGVEPESGSHIGGEYAAIDCWRPDQVQKAGVEVAVEGRAGQEAVTGQREVAATGDHARADIVAETPDLDPGQAGSLAAIVVLAALAIDLQGLVGR